MLPWGGIKASAMATKPILAPELQAEVPRKRERTAACVDKEKVPRATVGWLDWHRFLLSFSKAFMVLRCLGR